MEEQGFAPDPRNPGWYSAPAIEPGRFAEIFGAVSVRVESATLARIRIMPGPQHRNSIDTVHGGFILALIDQAIFIGPIALGIVNVVGGVTIDISTQFFAPLLADRAIDVMVELLRETGRMVFTRGLIEQDGKAAVSFTGTTRKGSPG